MAHAKTEKSALEKLLGLITEVKPGEALSAILLTVNVFLLLTSYYIIKPVRDALIVAMPDGAKYKSYMGAVIAVALLLAVPAYASFAKKLKRNRLVVGATLFFVSHIVLFAIAIQIPGSEKWLPLVFYLWVGIFNMMVVAQFWAFANDVYTEEQGKRLFAMIGIGASAGAAIGGALAKWLPKRPAANLSGGCDAGFVEVGYLSITQLLLLSGVLLALSALLTQLVHVRETKKEDDLKNTTAETPEAKDEVLKEKRGETPAKEAPKDDRGAFTMVFQHRYLMLLAAFSLLFTLVNTNGEFMISKLVGDWVFSSVGQCEFAEDGVRKAFISGMFTSWYGDFYFYVNVIGVALQVLVVSRLVKFGGLKVAFFVLPIIALFGAAAVLLFPLLSVIRPAKIAENATDYSVNNTVRNMLWLPTTRDMKYLAKQAVDTFFVRMGDVGSAILVFLFAELAGLGVRFFAGTNLVLIIGWLILAAAIIRENRKLSEQRDKEKPRED